MRFADGFGRSRNSATDQGACHQWDELHAHGPSEEVALVQGCDRQGGGHGMGTIRSRWRQLFCVCV